MKKTNEIIPVKYIGFYPVFTERLYKTGLVFRQGQTLNVDSEPAAKLLRHKDMFEIGNRDAAEAVENKAEATEVTKEEQLFEEENDLLDEIQKMDKEALKLFAFQNYEQSLDMRKNVATLREEVANMISLFGAV